jgi:hypothetical protein
MGEFKLLSSGEVIETRGLKVREQNVLTDRKKLKDGSAIDSVLSSCILTEGYDPREMLVGDRVALLIHLRCLTHGPKFLFNAVCRNCGERFMWEENLDELPVTYLDPPLPYGEDRIIECTLPRAGVKAKYRLLKGKDEKRARSGQTVEMGLSGILRVITTEVEGVKVLSAKWFDDLDVADADYLLAHWREHDCGVDTSLDLECPHCGAPTRMDLPIYDAGFFLPRTSRSSWRAM